MNKYIRLSIVVVLIAVSHSVLAQSFKKKIDIKFPDSYSGQIGSTSATNIYSNPTFALSQDGEGEFKFRVDGNWHYKMFSKGDVDDFSYLIEGFKAEGWDTLSSLEKIDVERAKGAIKTIYFTQFYISKYWDFRESFLSMGNSYGVYDIYINLVKVGSNLDIRNMATFDITEFVEEGFNDLMIICRSTKNSSRLEDNRINFPALNGDIYIYSTPKLRVKDIKINSYFVNEYKDGNLQLDIDIKTHLLNVKEAEMMYYLYDMKGKLLDKGSRWTKLEMKDSDIVNFHSLVKNVKLYSAETPYMYRAVLKLIHENIVTQTVNIDIPFVKYEYKNSSFFVNSVDTKLYGVVMGDEGIESDVVYRKNIINKLSSFKRNGFNAIILESPQRDIFYSLCDSLGLYVVDIANVNITNSGSSKDVSGTYANIPASTYEITKRVNSQYNRTKNHPSVIALQATKSMGNGYSLYEMYLKIKAINPNLMLASNGIDREWNNDFLVSYTDSVEGLESDMTNFVVAESMHSFNSIASLDSEITALFIPENELYKSLGEYGELNSVALTVVDSLNGFLIVERKNSIIQNSEIQLKYMVIANGKIFIEQYIKNDFDKQNRYDIELDLNSIDKAIIARYKSPARIEKIKFKIIVEIVAGEVSDLVEFEYRPKININLKK